MIAKTPEHQASGSVTFTDERHVESLHRKGCRNVGRRERRCSEDREQELLKAIVDGQRANGFAPTRRELAKQIGISVTRVQQLVDSCTEKGYLSRSPRTARGFEVR